MARRVSRADSTAEGFAAPRHPLVFIDDDDDVAILDDAILDDAILDDAALLLSGADASGSPQQQHPDGPDNSGETRLLEFLRDNNFSSPSFFTPSSPLQRDYHGDMPPQTRRQAAVAAAASSPTPARTATTGPTSLQPAGRGLPLSFLPAEPAPPAAPSRSAPSRAAQRAGHSPTETRTSTKRRRSSGEHTTAAARAEAAPAASAASATSATSTAPAPPASSAPTTLPPISALLQSIGGRGRGSGSGSQNATSQDSSGSGGGGDSSSSSNISFSQNTSQASRPRFSPKRPRHNDTIILDDDLFGSDDDGVEIVNLVNVDRPHVAKKEADEEEQAAAGEAEEAAPANPSLLKLSGLQCVICMDNFSNLTVTHCGHLFCGECLHSSLTTNTQQKICPICRTKLEMRTATMTAPKMARSYFPLQLKLRSSNKQGKQPVRPS